MALISNNLVNTKHSLSYLFLFDHLLPEVVRGEIVWYHYH